MTQNYIKKKYKYVKTFLNVNIDDRRTNISVAPTPLQFLQNSKRVLLMK